MTPSSHSAGPASAPVSSSPVQAEAPHGAPTSAVVPRLHFSIDRLVVDCPPGLRPEALRSEIEHQLQAECARRVAASGLPKPPTPDHRAPLPRIHATRRPDTYAARIVRAIVDRLWQ